MSEFEYYNIKKEREVTPAGGLIMPTDPFAEQMLSSTQNDDLKNISSRSIILAPFNSTKSQLQITQDEMAIHALVVPRNIIRFAPKVKEIERQYEMNNNAELDNGVYHQDSDHSPKEETNNDLTLKGLDNHSELATSFNAEQLQS